MDSASIVILGGPVHGSVAIDPVSGTVTYTPDPDFFGADSLRYRACDLAAKPRSTSTSCPWPTHPLP
jgi:hypothetical protein